MDKNSREKQQGIQQYQPQLAESQQPAKGESANFLVAIARSLISLTPKERARQTSAIREQKSQDALLKRQLETMIDGRIAEFMRVELQGAHGPFYDIYAGMRIPPELLQDQTGLEMHQRLDTSLNQNWSDDQFRTGQMLKVGVSPEYLAKWYDLLTRSEVLRQKSTEIALQELPYPLRRQQYNRNRMGYIASNRSIDIQGTLFGGEHFSMLTFVNQILLKGYEPSDLWEVYQDFHLMGQLLSIITAASVADQRGMLDQLKALSKMQNHGLREMKIGIGSRQYGIDGLVSSVDSTLNGNHYGYGTVAEIPPFFALPRLLAGQTPNVLKQRRLNNKLPMI